MKILHKLSISVASIVGILAVAIEPSKAALLDFSFVTEQGAVGEFTLNTDAEPANEPAIFRFGFTGVAYLDAVTDFSLTAPYLTLDGVTTDFNVVPDLADFLGIPGSGAASGISYDPGCIIETGLTCTLGLSISYLGDLTTLPALSDDPTTYASGTAVSIFENSEPISRDFITEFQVTSRTPVPEPTNSIISLLACTIGSATLLRKHKNKRQIKL